MDQVGIPPPLEFELLDKKIRLFGVLATAGETRGGMKTNTSVWKR